MAIKIESKITGYAVQKPEDIEADAKQKELEALAEKGRQAEAEADARAKEKPMAEIIQMHEAIARPECLDGASYKIKTPLSEHSLYVTINDIILNKGTEHEQRRPFEIFINSKNMDHFQWIVALTRIISAVFRKGGDVTFLAEELKAVFDPKGGYFKPGGKFMPSLVAEIGDVIEQHLTRIGMINNDLDDHQKAFIEKKKAEINGQAPAKPVDAVPAKDHAKADSNDFPATAQLCTKCHTKAMVQMDNCMTCLNCGESKCG